MEPNEERVRQRPSIRHAKKMKKLALDKDVTTSLRLWV